MAADRSTLDMRHDGVLVPSARARELLDAGPGDQLELTPLGGGFALLHRAGAEQAGIVLAGKLERVGVPRLLGFLHSAGSSGALTMTFVDATKTLVFKDGSLVFASSSLRDDRLGECLVRARKISRTDLVAANEAVQAGTKLGKALVERGHIAPNELWEGLKFQVEQILLSTFQYASGTFSFYERDIALKGTVQLDHSMPHYILEGARRMEQLQTHLAIVAHPDALLRRSLDAPVSSVAGAGEVLSGLERDVLELVDGKATVSDIVRASSWSEHNTLLALARLRAAGRVVDRLPSQRPPEPDLAATATFVRDTVARTNVVLARIHAALVAHGGAEAAAALGSFFDEMKPSLQALFEGVRFDASGRLDARLISANLAQLGGDAAETHLTRGLDELLAFAVFTATDILPADEGEQLIELLPGKHER